MLEYDIRKYAERHPDKDAIVSGQEKVSYRELWRMIEERSNELQSSTEHINLIKTSPSIGFLVEYLASHLANKVAVPLAHDIADEEYTNMEAP